MKVFHTLIASLCLCLIVAIGFPLSSEARGGGGGKGHAGISHSFGGKHSTTSSGSSSKSSYKSPKGYSKSTYGKHAKTFSYKKSKSSTTIAKFSKTGKSHRLTANGGYKHLKYSKKLSFDGTVKRDSNGRIARSETAKHDYLKMHGYGNKVPPGYQVDHIVPLYAGGRDDPSNMQLISVAQHHAKTKADFEKYGR